MEISSRFVGTPLKEHHVEITWRELMNYAAAVDDHNPIYFDDQRPEGIIAHPIFPAAVTWRTLGSIWEHIEDQEFPFHLLATQVHYTEHLAYHRPIRPGNVLKVGGQIAAILPHRSGALVVVRLDALGADGGPVFTEHASSLLRGVRCTDGGTGGEALPAVPTHPEQGAPVWDAPVAVEPLRPFIYDGCSGISFPIHTSQQFARQMGLPGIILQGTATLAFAARELVNREASGNSLALHSLFGRFTGMVLPGAEIRVQLTAKKTGEERVDLHFVVLNSDGRNAISDGYARLRKTQM
jgi:acyl dehydratase